MLCLFLFRYIGCNHQDDTFRGSDRLLQGHEHQDCAECGSSSHSFYDQGGACESSSGLGYQTG